MTEKEFLDLVDELGPIPSETMDAYLWLQRVANAAEAKERGRCLKAVSDEEELSGQMTERVIVHCVKRNITMRIEKSP